jgi:hypothetical protein
MFNFDLLHFPFLPSILFQVITGLLVPVLASLTPFLNMLKVSAVQAMNAFGTSNRFVAKAGLTALFRAVNCGLPALSFSSAVVVHSQFVSQQTAPAVHPHHAGAGGRHFISVFQHQSSIERTLDDFVNGTTST